MSAVGLLFGALILPVLENINPVFWELTFRNAALLVIGSILFANFALWVGGATGVRAPFLWQFAKYGAVGALSSLLDVGLLNLFSIVFDVYKGLLLAGLNVVAIVIALVNNYFLNKFWAFKNGHPIHVREVLKFLSVHAVSITLNTTILYILTTIVGAPGDVTAPVWENVAKVVAIPVTVTINFLGFRYIVFPKRI